ncbi:MAG: glycosyl transferase family 1 [Bryobacteraceae bacterium]|nr:glycosyl transferase family 1 [Bryobacteraceae bacterium]
MSHIGIVCPAVPGHLNPLASLGRKLQGRGHRVTIFHLPDAEAAIRQTGLGFWMVGSDEFPAGSTKRFYEKLGSLQGLAAFRLTLGNFVRKTKVWLMEIPDAIRASGVDFLLVDELEGGGTAVAEHMQMPFVTVSSALVLLNEPDVPPVFTPWSYTADYPARVRNQAGYWLQRRLMTSCHKVLTDQRLLWGLPPSRTVNDWSSPWAHVSQQPAFFDFPRRDLPRQFHYTGPFYSQQERKPVPFPYEKLTGQRMIYASMGTLQNRVGQVFREIATACTTVDAQLVISLGGGSHPEELGKLPGDPIVVAYAPQLDLLARASLTITHAGLNTTLESLSNGVPLVSIPVANDQPGVAARTRWLGAGETLPFRNLEAGRLRSLVQTVLEGKTYRAAAAKVAERINSFDGLGRAVEIVEQVIATKRPVLYEANRKLARAHRNGL